MVNKPGKDDAVILAAAILFAPRLQGIAMQEKLDAKQLRSFIVEYVLIAQELRDVAASTNYAKEKAEDEKRSAKVRRDLNKAVKKLRAKGWTPATP
jgi:hypothetical protein